MFGMVKCPPTKPEANDHRRKSFVLWGALRTELFGSGVDSSKLLHVKFHEQRRSQFVIYIYIYIYIEREREREREFDLWTFFFNQQDKFDRRNTTWTLFYICVHILLAMLCVCVCVCSRQRERETDRQTEIRVKVDVDRLRLIDS